MEKAITIAVAVMLAVSIMSLAVERNNKTTKTVENFQGKVRTNFIKKTRGLYASKYW